MTLVRFRPFSGHDRPTVPRRFSDLMDDFFNDALVTGEQEHFAPRVDISEDNAQYHVKMNLPGVTKEDVKISMDGNLLTVSGERRKEEEKKDAKYHLIESSYGTFERAFTLPDNADADSIEAELTDGVLHVSVAKKQKKESKEIKVS